MKAYIDKAAIVAEIRKRFDEYSNSILKHYDACTEARASELGKILIILDTLEVKEADLIDRKTDWSPSKKQLESLKDLLHYNIGVFDYQKFMEVNSLYEDLIKLLDYETDRQK